MTRGSVPCGAPVGAGRGCSIGRRRAPALGNSLGLPGCRRGCPLRGAARPRPRRRGRAAATAGDARSRGPSGAAAPRPGLSCLPQSLCAFCAQGRSASAPHASNRAAPLVRPTTTTGLAMDRSVAGECLLVSYGTLAGFANWPSFCLLGTYRVLRTKRLGRGAANAPPKRLSPMINR